VKRFNPSSTKEQEKDLAQTPWDVVEIVQGLIGAEFMLDVCATAETAKAKKYYSLQEGTDGLTLQWELFNWCNPPFSTKELWVNKAIEEAKERGAHTMMLLPDQPETKVSRLAFEAAQCVLRPNKRIRFLKPNGEPFLDSNGKVKSPSFSSALYYITPIGQHCPASSIYFFLGFAEKG